MFFSALINQAAIKKFSHLKQLNFEKFYRLPFDKELVLLPYYVSYIKYNYEIEKQKNVAFIGSSPTYGVSIKDSQNTYPYAYKLALQKIKPFSNFVFYNLSSKGFLLSDQYYILKSIINYCDIFFIQLNYHTFGSFILNDTKIRHPEIAEKLGVTVTPLEGKVINVHPNTYSFVNYELRDFIKKYWFFYRESDRIALDIFGDIPEIYLHKMYNQFFEKQKNELYDSFTPFIDLSPTQQSILVRRYREASQFIINENNTELFFLQQTLSLLKKHNKKALFFLAPINVNALNYFEAINWQQYKQNTSLIAKTIEKFGFSYIDYNLEKPMSEELFSDITHTIDAGGISFGNTLFEDTKNQVLSLL